MCLFILTPNVYSLIFLLCLPQGDGVLFIFISLEPDESFYRTCCKLEYFKTVQGQTEDTHDRSISQYSYFCYIVTKKILFSSDEDF